MSETYDLFDQKTCAGTPNATSSPASEAGPTRSGSQDGRTTGRYGQEAVRASHSPSRGSAVALATRAAIYGRTGSGSSASAALSLSLASRYQAKTASLGSTLFRLIWKRVVTPSGRSIPALRASARRTSGNDFTSWPTPQSHDAQAPKSEAQQEAVRRRGHGVANLNEKVLLALWPTPTANDAGRFPAADFAPTPNLTLNHAALLASWATPTANPDNKTPDAHLAMKNRMGERDGTNANRTAITDIQVMAKICTPVRLTATGELLTGSTAATANGGQLSPAHSRWLMGFPREWDDCAPLVTRSFRRSRRNSSALT